MIVARSEHPRFRSNSYLVADRPGGKACIVDTGADPAPLLAAIEAHDLEVDWVLLTHHHHDHTEHNAFWSERFTAPLCGHRNEVVLFGEGGPSPFDVAHWAGTITYELVCGLTGRVTRRYVYPS